MNTKNSASGVLKTIVFFVFVFFFSAVVGFHNYHSAVDIIIPLLDKMKNDIFNPTSQLSTAFNVFMNNLSVSLIIYLTGITVILPILIVSFNGFIVGFFTRYSIQHEEIGLALFVKGVLAHSIFELPALFIAASYGLRVGTVFYSLLFEILEKHLKDEQKNPKQKITLIKKRMNEGAVVFISIVLPLLLIAAFIEVYITAWLLGLY
ncbi:MAG: stage II sporulation protein M [Candidatus Altiarchaeota archaeon]|nr:stage II sporulation protein M [Candidatus Altiarchaeota archaeon]